MNAVGDALHKDGGNVADGAVTADGLAFGTYLHGLFDSDDLPVRWSMACENVKG
jgi:cobyric acid synthase